MTAEIKRKPEEGGDAKSTSENAAATRSVQEITPADQKAQSQAQADRTKDSSAGGVLPTVRVEDPAKATSNGSEKPAAGSEKPVAPARAGDQSGAKPGDKDVEKPGKPMDRQALEREVEALRVATGRENYVARWADREKIIDLLKNRSEDERKVMDEIYKKKYGIGIQAEMTAFMSGSDLTKFLAAFNRKDKAPETSSATDRLAAGLTERGEWTGRSNSIIEKDLRDTLRTANADQIAKISKEYQEKYGVPLKDAIEKNPYLKEHTKEALLIYLNGNDKRQPGDFEKLTNSALKSGDLQFFKEVMKDAKPEERAKFSADGGDARLTQTWSSTNLNEARDFVREGKLGTSTQIRENTGNLWDNNKGIELALSRMTDAERSDYRIGRSLKGDSTPLNDADKERLSKMSEADKTAARAKHTEVRSSLEAAGNDTELARWENMIDKKGGSFVANLDKHRGHLWNDSAAEIGNSVANMSKKDWEEAKANPNSRKELETMLLSLNKTQKERDDILAVFDKKMKAEDFEKAQDVGKVSISSQLDNKWGYFKNDQQAMLNAINSMSKEDREKYRSDDKYKEEVDKKVRNYMSGEALVQAQRTLRMVETGQNVQGRDNDIVAKLAGHGSNVFTDKAQAIREVRDAFDSDPKLRERITNPQTDADKKFAADFAKAGKEALGESKYNEYIGDLLKTGKLSAEKMTYLSKGYFSDDEETTYEDVAKAPKEERDKLVNDKAYQETALSHLNQEERKIALAAAAQGEYKPEDKIRSMVIGYGGSTDLVETLKGVPKEKLAQLKEDYAKKYGSSFESDIYSKLGGQELIDAKRILVSDKSQAVQVEQARDEAYKTRSGIGAGYADWVSATGRQADDTLDTLLQKGADANAKGETVNPEDMKVLLEDFGKAMDNHRETKNAAADYTADALIAGGAIASVIATGGTDLPLVAALLAAGGAASKVGTKAVLQGSDYDWRAGNVGKDLAVGALTGATAVFGQAELAAVFKVGQRAATTATTASIEMLGKESLVQIGKRAGVEVAETAAGKAFLVNGYEKILAEGTEQTMRQLLANGAKKIDEKAFAALADKIVDASIEGPLRQAAVAAVQKEIATQATKEFTKETANFLVRHATAQGLNAGAGAGGNSVSGVVEGAADWDSRKSLYANLGNIGSHTFNATLAGGGGALFFGGLMKAGESGWSGLNHVRGRNSESPHVAAAAGETAPAARADGQAPETRVADARTADSRTPESRPDVLAREGRAPESATPEPMDARMAMASIDRTPPVDAVHGADAPQTGERLWSPVRDLDKMTPEAKAALLREVGDSVSPLNTAVKVNDFVTLIDEQLQKPLWQKDYSHLADALKERQAAWRESAEGMQTVMDRYGFKRSEGDWDTKFYLEAAKDYPDDVAAIKRYIDARQSYADTVDLQNRVLKERAASIQQAMDKFTEANNLPRVEVHHGQNSDMVGANARYNDGRMYLHPDQMLGSRRTADIFESAYHELTHHDQRFTIGRAVADELNIGANYTANELDIFGKVYEFRTGQKISPEQSRLLLDARAKQTTLHLDEVGTNRAYVMAEAFKANSPAGAKLVELGNDFRVVRGKLSSLRNPDEPNSVEHLLLKLMEDKDEQLSRRLFGSAQPPKEVVQFYQNLRKEMQESAGTWTHAQKELAKDYLEDRFSRRLRDINNDRKETYDGYMRAHEVDALLSGQRARARAMERGYEAAPEIRVTRGDGLEVEYLSDFGLESAGRHSDSGFHTIRPDSDGVSSGSKSGDAKVAKPARVQLENGQGTLARYDVANDSFDFVDSNLRFEFDKTPFISRNQSVLKGRPLAVGDTLRLPPEGEILKTYINGRVQPVEYTVVSVGENKVRLSYKGEARMSRASLRSKTAQEVDDFALVEMTARVTQPGFRVSSGSNELLIRALSQPDVLPHANISAINFALQGKYLDETFERNLMQEVRRRARTGDIQVVTARNWLERIADRPLKPSERGADYVDFLRHMNPELMESLSKLPPPTGAKQPLVYTAINEALKEARLTHLPGDERAKLLVNALHALDTSGAKVPAAIQAANAKVYGLFDPVSISTLSKEDRAYLMQRANKYADDLDIRAPKDQDTRRQLADWIALRADERLLPFELDRVLDGMTASELAAARKIFADDASFMTMHGVNSKIDKLASDLRAVDTNSSGGAFLRVARPGETDALFRNVEILSVQVNDDGAGRALAYAFRKRTGISVDIHSASQNGSPQGRFVVFSRDKEMFGATTKALEARGDAHVAADMADFDQHINIFDMAAAKERPELVQEKLRRLIKERGLERTPASGDAAQESAGIHKLLLEDNTHEQLIRDRALLSILRLPKERAMATAHTYAHAAEIVHMSDLYSQAQTLHRKLTQGRSADDMIYVVDADKEGSALLMTEIMRRANGGRGQYVTRDILSIMDASDLKGKTLVVVDDSVYSGKTVLSHAKELERIKAKQAPGTDLKLVVATLSGQERGINEFAAARTARLTAGAAVGDVASLEVAHVSTNFQDAALEALQAVESAKLASDTGIDAAMERVGTSQWKKSNVVTGIVNPHMLPNNNSGDFNAVFGAILDRPSAHSESPLRAMAQPLHYGPSAARVEDAVTRGRAGSKAQLQQVIDENEGGWVIDLRHNSDKPETTIGPGSRAMTPQQEQAFIAELAKNPKYKNLEYHQIPTSTAAGSPISEAAVNDVLTLLALAKEAGIPVYIHCQRGCDRTGYMVARHRMSEAGGGWSKAKAWKEMLAYGFDKRLSHLYDLLK